MPSSREPDSASLENILVRDNLSGIEQRERIERRLDRAHQRQFCRRLRPFQFVHAVASDTVFGGYAASKAANHVMHEKIDRMVHVIGRAKDIEMHVPLPNVAKILSRTWGYAVRSVSSDSRMTDQASNNPSAPLVSMRATDLDDLVARFV
jgi:hypothetical protein